MFSDILDTNGRMALFAGPCVIESGDIVLQTAKAIKQICDKCNVEFYFKSSFDKANRTSAEHFRGPGLEKGLNILQQVKSEIGVRILTDIHEPWQAQRVADVADIIQIPAFLCRQTDLLKAAAETGKIINVKKAQFMSPEEMESVVKKIEYFGNHKITLCERGTCFGYHNQIVDMTGIVRMQKFHYPVIFDATHSVQVSGGGEENSNTGNSEYIPCLAKAAIAAGANGLFMEVHPDPEKALCDGKCMLKLSNLDALLSVIVKIYHVVQKRDFT